MCTSAEIIPFPACPPCVPAPAEEGAARLRRALAVLDLALAEQRAAVAVWRGELAALQGSVAGLDGALRRYADRLAGLRGHTEGLHEQAQRLEAWADAGLRG